MKVLLTSAYWPNLHYFYYLLNADSVCIEQYDNYSKQSYRNRCEILSANGRLSLSVPVQKNKLKQLMNDVLISYKENWQVKHWRALTSAYKNSPYFEFFEDEIRYFYDNQIEHLLRFNTEQLKIVLKLLQVKKEIDLSSEYIKNPPGWVDLREKIHPKTGYDQDLMVSASLQKPYYQTFEDKFGFSSNLSVLDLIFNVGLQSKNYLHYNL